MKKFVLACAGIVAASCVLLFSSCIGETGKRVVCKGEVVTREISGLAGFEALMVNGAADLTFVQAEEFSVTVKANAQVFDHIDYKVEDGVLLLQALDNVNIVAEEYDIRVAAPYLASVTVNGAADFDVKGGYRADTDFAVTINGAGDFELRGIVVPGFFVTVNGAGDISADNIDVETLEITINGAGEAELSGKAEHARLSVSGAGEIDARQLVCEDVSVRKSGVATVKLRK